MNEVKTTIEQLSRSKKSTCCNGRQGLIAALKKLGFEGSPGQANHKVFVHKALSEISAFRTFSIDCGHKPNRSMKAPYILNTIRILKKYQIEIQEILDKEMGVKNHD
jgi:hypothetical protein